MLLQDHRNISLAEQVFLRLENDILSGVYQSGEILTEMKLVADMGVSRTPVREALHRLELEHLIEIGAKGILIIGVSKQDLIDIFTVRQRIEGLAAKLCAERISEEDLSDLKEALDLQEFYVGKADPDHIRSMDSRFHQIIYHASGSPVLEDVLLPLHRKTQKYRKMSVQDNGRAVLSAEEHRKIYDAIASHNADEAEKAMNAHIQHAAESIIGGFRD